MPLSPHHNPYVVGSWVNGAAYYGHIGLRFNLLYDPNRQLWVVGTRRVGKTSLLRQLMADAGPEFVPLYWDMQACQSADDLNSELNYSLEERAPALHEIGVEVNALANQDFRQALQTVSLAAAAHNRQILLLIDEPEALLTIGADQDMILRRLRLVFQRQLNLRVVLTSTKVFSRIQTLTQHWLTSSFLQDFSPRNLSGMEPVESEALIRQSQGQRVDVDAKTLAVIQYHTNHHPYLVQWLCRKLYQENNSLRHPDEHDLQTDATLNGLWEITYKHLSPSERCILLHLASDDPGRARDEAGLAAALHLRPADAHLYLYALTRLGYTRISDGQVGIGNTFFAQWLQTRADSLPIDDAEIADSLVKEVASTGHQQEKAFWQQQLQTFRVNLARLEVQAANYGLTVPLSLQNEIDFHLRKIADLEGRLDGLNERPPSRLAPAPAPG